MTTQEGLPALATNAETPMSDHIARFIECAADGWRIQAHRPDGLASSSFGADFGPALAEAFRRSAASAEPAAWQRKIKAANADWKWVQIDSRPEERAEWVRLGYEIRPLYAAPPSPVVSEAIVNRATVALINEFGGEFPYGEAKEIVALILNAALSPAPAGEVGWRTVPVEPTQAMMDAGIRARAEGWGAGRIRNAYLAMLAASPLPPSPTGGDKP